MSAVKLLAAAQRAPLLLQAVHPLQALLQQARTHQSVLGTLQMIERFGAIMTLIPTTTMMALPLERQ